MERQQFFYPTNYLVKQSSPVTREKVVLLLLRLQQFLAYVSGCFERKKTDVHGIALQSFGLLNVWL